MLLMTWVYNTDTFIQFQSFPEREYKIIDKEMTHVVMQSLEI